MSNILDYFIPLKIPSTRAWHWSSSYLFKVKDNWYQFKIYIWFDLINLFHCQLSQSILHHFQRFWNILVLRIQKLSLILEINEKLTVIFKVKGIAQFLICNGRINFHFHANTLDLYFIFACMSVGKRHQDGKQQEIPVWGL